MEEIMAECKSRSSIKRGEFVSEHGEAWRKYQIENDLSHFSMAKMVRLSTSAWMRRIKREEESWTPPAGVSPKPAVSADTDKKIGTATSPKQAVRAGTTWLPAQDPPLPVGDLFTCSRPVFVQITAGAYNRIGEAAYSHRYQKWIILDGGEPAERVTHWHPEPEPNEIPY